MKDKFRGRVQFGSIADMVFSNLVMQKFRENDSLYQGLSEVMDEQMNKLQLLPGSRPSRDSTKRYTWLRRRTGALPRDRRSGSLEGVRPGLGSLPVLRQPASGQVVSGVDHYIIANTAPMYTIERIMLFNITGPREGKSYANNVLIYSFRRVRGCIESLTSFTRKPSVQAEERRVRGHNRRRGHFPREDHQGLRRGV
ncbi:hypothetical protein KUCAC02_007857 [Chaenocephalus aceratus]|uniref:Uncharacterized protein n=1 Tax=Chaenocephalus aceratus TaxID=36190 RepID=A0ACB9X7L4_CHAAC|nr:hypothetical protein KUCAC02_007857 [Chaenocephalus aceratus]